MEKRVRSRYFVLSGGLGGLAGFLLMEIVASLSDGPESRMGYILWRAFYFAGFGLAVGAALGMTEGFIQKKRNRMVYGLTMGLILGVVGGFVGGAVGQAIYGSAPRKIAAASNTDVAIALDSSSSMSGFLWIVGGNDPNGERRRAARNLIDQMSAQDRVAVVDFDGVGNLLFPLTPVDSSTARESAKQAVDRIDDWGDTNLSAGLDLAIEELSRNKIAGRKQFLIFLTDGEGYYDGAAQERARTKGITIYTIGLGPEVKAGLLTSIAQATGGTYHPVSNASQLSLLFQQIYTEHVDMASQAVSPAQGVASSGGSPIHYILRILSWALMGLAIGAGQGVRENTREDLRACSLGGFLGGAVGGALFNPLTSVVSLGAGMAGRCLADVVVGACIGGSMRLAQEKFVEESGKPTTMLLSMLPQKGGLTVLPQKERPQKDAPVPVPASATEPRPVPVKPPAPVPVPAVAAASSQRVSLVSYQEKYTDRTQAMAMAYRSGDFTLREVAEHFGVQPTAVKRAAEQHAGRA